MTYICLCAHLHHIFLSICLSKRCYYQNFRLLGTWKELIQTDYYFALQCSLEL